MERGHIASNTIPGPFDLAATLECGQTFLWQSIEDTWYRTVHDRTVIEIRERDGGLDWRSSTDPTDVLRKRLGLDADLDQILADFPDEPVVQQARDRYAGLRIMTEPTIPTIHSFILSAQMRLDRIHENVTRLRETYGDAITWRDTDVYSFPEQERLAGATETELRDLGFGYRAPYVKATAEMLRDDVIDLQAVMTEPYETARETLTEFVGVGPKVADCVLLFGMDFEEPVPLDTWIRTAIETHFPSAERDSYAETSRAIRNRLGPRPGYAQTYVFNYLRTDGGTP